jgi:hypothetical protein
VRDAQNGPADIRQLAMAANGDVTGIVRSVDPGADLSPTEVAPVARAPIDVQRSLQRLTPEQEVFNRLAGWRSTGRCEASIPSHSRVCNTQ